mmetsp:Transcript_28609/g.101353  ORF Transcript_28609/g.101353 Transcript_28609/m.101353 type:complete len:362 (+) Transcript_28609:130-1215(+)
MSRWRMSEASLRLRPSSASEHCTILARCAAVFSLICVMVRKAVRHRVTASPRSHERSTRRRMFGSRERSLHAPHVKPGRSTLTSSTNQCMSHLDARMTPMLASKYSTPPKPGTADAMENGKWRTAASGRASGMPPHDTTSPPRPALALATTLESHVGTMAGATPCSAGGGTGAGALASGACERSKTDCIRASRAARRCFLTSSAVALKAPPSVVCLRRRLLPLGSTPIVALPGAWCATVCLNVANWDRVTGDFPKSGALKPGSEQRVAPSSETVIVTVTSSSQKRASAARKPLTVYWNEPGPRVRWAQSDFDALALSATLAQSGFDMAAPRGFIATQRKPGPGERLWLHPGRLWAPLVSVS